MAVQNSLVSRAQKTGLTAYLSMDKVRDQINKVVGGKNGTKFVASVISAAQANPQLQECTNPSILSAALVGQSLNLSPSPQLGQYYMVPYKNKKKNCKEAEFQIGYKGYIQLALRTGQYKKLNVLAIKEGELIRFDPLNEEIEVKLIEDEEERENTPTAGYYAMFEYTNGFKKAMYWSKNKMLAHADKYAPAFTKKGLEDLEAGRIPEKDMWKYSSFWYKDFDAMAYKTMLRQIISKWGIMSIELQTAMESDMAVINEDGTRDYVETGEYQEAEVVEDAEPEVAEPEQQSFFQ